MADILIKKINYARRTAIAKLIEQRIGEFQETYNDDYKVFSELCFCITTANSSAEMGIKVQKALYGKIEKLSKKELANQLRVLGYRFPNKRAEYLHKAKKWKGILQTIKTGDWKRETELREWLVQNILGFGYKEASHFLRNIGFRQLAILDRHVLRTMHEHGMIKKLPKTLGRNKYLEYEKKLGGICKKTGLSHSQLDLYLWHMKTGKVLK